jgi:hypothetical protein
VLRLDASVLDAEGRAVRDLRATDFQVEISGRPRTVPSTVILISGGLGFDPSALGRFEQVAAELKQAGIAVYAVQVDQREVDASPSRPAKAST